MSVYDGRWAPVGAGTGRSGYPTDAPLLRRISSKLVSPVYDLRTKEEPDLGMKRSSGREWLSQKSSNRSPYLYCLRPIRVVRCCVLQQNANGR